MSRPRFLVNHDFNEHIARGVERLEPAVELLRVRDLSLAGASDAELLEYAAAHGLLVLSHDVNTMSAAASERLRNGLPLAGLVLAHQRIPVALVIADVFMIWAATEATEWENQIQFLPL